MTPVYVVNGFLESGKTEFIIYTIAQPYFQVQGKTLLLLCEDGENEYEEALLKKAGTVLERIEKEKDFTPEYLRMLEKKHKPERIIIEYNGMWNYKNMKLPQNWHIEQQITTINAATFSMYLANMRSLLVEMVRGSEMIIFNRCDGIADLSSYKRSIKAVSQTAEIIFEDSDGELSAIMEEELPYDMKAEVITLESAAYVVWYLDALERLDRYIGRKIRFTAQVLKPETFPDGYFVPGRMAMTCCADDITFLGFACRYNHIEKLGQRQWVSVTAKVNEEYFDAYHGTGPVLEAITVEDAKAPQEEVINFV